MSLSVLIPNYNHSRFLPEVLDQVFAQSLQPDEVIIIDDASTDESVEVIQGYQKKYPALRLIQNEKNQGVVKNVNAGTALAKGKYIIYLAADDGVFPGFFERSVQALEAFPDAGLCTGKMAFFSEEKPPYHFRCSEVKKAREGYFSPKALISLLRKTPFFIYTTASCYRRGGIPLQKEAYGYIADWDMNMKVAFEKGIVYLPHLFGACRVMESSYAARSKGCKVNRSRIFESLIEDLQERGGLWEEAMFKGGLLSHLGVKMVAHVARHPRYWRYLPATFMKKWQYYLGARHSKRLMHL